MAEYRDPKVTTPTGSKAGMGRWIWIAAAAIVLLLLLFWIFGGDDEVEVESEGVVTEEPAGTVAPEAPAAN